MKTSTHLKPQCAGRAMMNSNLRFERDVTVAGDGTFYVEQRLPHHSPTKTRLAMLGFRRCLSFHCYGQRPTRQRWIDMTSRLFHRRPPVVVFVDVPIAVRDSSGDCDVRCT